jgi:two-component system CheB/CheR fusion protein
MPYRTTENVINGLVITFVDISKLKATEEMVRKLTDHRYANDIGQVLHESLLVLDTDLYVITANQRFYDVFHLLREGVEKQHLYALDDRQWDIPELRHLFETLLGDSSVYNNFEIEHTFSRAGHKVLLLNVRRLESEGDAPDRILLAIQDVTAYRGDAR